jgi:flagellar hook-length control protein FliK
MQDMIDAIRASIEIAARQGVAQARIALEPEDLGHISIRLSQTSDGLLARVSADTPAAVQALADGRSELHQSLSSLGVSLLRLDIGSFGQPQAGAREDQNAGNPGGTSGANASQDSEEPQDGATAGSPEALGATASIAGGELVDVLA